MALASVVIPTHNRARTLLKAIESAKNAGENVEVIVVDDASTDETASVCQELDGIVFIRLERNSGQSVARNAGILRSTGEFVAFLDDDDLRIPGSLDRQIDLLTENEGFGFAYGRVHIGDSERCQPTGEIRPARCPSGDIFWQLLSGNFIYIASVLVRRRSLEKVGLFDPHIRGTEDWDLWIRLAEAYPVGALEEPVAVYRDFTPNSNQTSSNKPKMFESSVHTLDNALNRPRGQDLDRQFRKKLRSDFMNIAWDDLIREGKYALSAGRYRYAAINYATAIRLNPKRVFRPAAVMNFLRDLARAKVLSK